MFAKDIIKEIMSIKGLSQSKLAEKADFKSQSNVTGILNRGNSLRVDKLVKMVEAMGYEVVIREKDHTSNEWVVKG